MKIVVLEDVSINRGGTLGWAVRKENPALLASLREAALDDTAKAIVEQLQQDGRRPYAAIGKAVGLSEAAVRQRVILARDRQLMRQNICNARLSGIAMDRHCHLRPPEQQLLRQAMERLRLSARAYHRVLRVARTIADLDHSMQVEAAHLGEALGYRNLDRPVG